MLKNWKTIGKRSLSAFLALVMCLGMVCTTAFAEGEGEGATTETGPVVCTKAEGCAAETHVEGCPKYVAPEETEACETCGQDPCVCEEEEEQDGDGDTAALDKFNAAVAAMGDATDMESTLAALNAIETAYAALSDEEKASVADLWAYTQGYAEQVRAGNPDGGVNTLDEGIEPQVEQTEAQKLQAALNAGGEVKLVNNVTIPNGTTVTVPANVEVILDLNGQTITEKSTGARNIVNRGTLTVRDSGSNGEIKNTVVGEAGQDGCYGLIDNYGTLTIESGKFTDVAHGNASSIRNRTGATLTISGGVFVNTADDSQKGTDYAGAGNAFVYSDGTKVTISGGSFTMEKIKYTPAIKIADSGECEITNATIRTYQSGGIEADGGTVTIKNANIQVAEANSYYGNALAVSGSGTVNVEDGTFTGYKYGAYVYNSGGTFNIKGGTFKAETVLMAQATNGAKAIVNVSGGTFDGKITESVQTTGSTAEVFLSGGTFTGEENVAKYIAPSAVQDEDGTIRPRTETDTDAVAKVGEDVYASLQAAVDAADGQTVTLVKDTVEMSVAEAGMVIEETVTLDLNQKTLNITGVGNNGITVQNQGSLTIQNGTVKAENVTKVTNPVIVVNSGASVSLNGVNFSTDGTALYPRGDAAKVSVVGSEISAPNCYAVATNAGTADNYDVIIELKDSTFEGNSPILINVPGKLVMDNCNVTGAMHGVIVRGGDAEIKNSTIVQNYPDDNADTMANYFTSRDWGQGNMVNLAAITIGNKHTTSYQYPSNVIITDTEVKVEGKGESVFPCIYVYANGAEGKGVTLAMEGNTLTGKYTPQIEYGNDKNNVTEAIAAVNGTAYKTLQEAINAATKGQTVTLVKDTAESVTIAKEQNITLDLNGKKLESSDPKKGNEEITGKDNPTHTIINKGTLTIKDSQGNGCIVGMNRDADVWNSTEKRYERKVKPYIALQNDGTCTIESGLITRAPYLATEDDGKVQDNTGTNSNYTIRNNGTMTISGGQIKNNSQKSAMVSNNGTMTISGGALDSANYTAIQNQPDHTLTITGGTITGGTDAHCLSLYGTTTIKDNAVVNGYIQVWTYDWYNNDGTLKQKINTVLNIEGGTINDTQLQAINGLTGYDPETSAIKWATEGSSAKINITGGTLNLTGGIVTNKIATGGNGMEKVDNKTNSVEIIVSGGTFSTAVPAEYCAAGYIPMQNGDRYGVTTPRPITGVTLSQPTASLYRNTTPNTVTLTATVAPADTTDNTAVTWTSSNPAVATVSNGVVTAVANGTATITATAGGYSATCTVTVSTYSSGGGSSSGGGGGGGSSRPNPPSVEIDDPDVPLADLPLLFTDVGVDAYYVNAVKWAVHEKITLGTSDTTFSPDGSCTRAQMVTFLWRAAGSPAPQGNTNPFTDVVSGAYYYDAVLWAVEQGITLGTSDTTFSPDAEVTRGQSVTFLYRTAGSPTVNDGKSFGDVDSSAFYAKAVQWAADKGVTLGTSETTFSPNDNCTRAQIVMFLYRNRVS